MDERKDILLMFPKWGQQELMTGEQCPQPGNKKGLVCFSTCCIIGNEDKAGIKILFQITVNAGKLFAAVCIKKHLLQFPTYLFSMTENKSPVVNLLQDTKLSP